MTISKELLDELLSGVERPEDLLGDKGLIKELKVRLMERMLGAELTEHLGYEPHGEPASQQSNRRNGATRKVLKGNDGAVPIDIPRDRDGSFEPELIRKGQTRIDGMDDKIIGLYAAGLSTRDIRSHLEEGFPDAINAAYPDTTVQTCIVHLVRHSLNFCGWKDRKAVAKSLKRIYQAVNDEEAAKALDDFDAEWGDKYPSIAPSWRRAWQEVIPFFAFPPAVRKIIYTTNAIESLNRVIRKTTKTRGSFPTDDAATKLIYLAIRNFEKAGRCVREWVAARNQFAILYPERFNK